MAFIIVLQEYEVRNFGGHELTSDLPGKQYLTLMNTCSCAAGQGIDWMQFRIRNGYTHGVYGNSFYTCLVLSSVSVTPYYCHLQSGTHI